MMRPQDGVYVLPHKEPWVVACLDDCNSSKVDIALLAPIYAG
jgi:hypothetical protein